MASFLSRLRPRWLVPVVVGLAVALGGAAALAPTITGNTAGNIAGSDASVDPGFDGSLISSSPEASSSASASASASPSPSPSLSPSPSPSPSPSDTAAAKAAEAEAEAEADAAEAAEAAEAPPSAGTPAAPPAQDAVYSSCNSFGEYTKGSWMIYNNVWGNQGNDSQCLHVNSMNSWYVDSTQSGGGIKSYPNTSVRPHTPLAQLKSATFTYNTSSAPARSGDWWNWTSDIWSTGNQDEVMIFTSWYPKAGGWGTKVRSDVTIGGVRYAEVWQANPGWNVLQLIPASQSNSGTVDALAVWKWAASEGLLVNTDFDTMQFGLEITSTSGQQKRYSLNEYHARWTSTSGGGSGI